MAAKLSKSQATHLRYGWAPESTAKALERRGLATLGATEHRYPRVENSRGTRFGYFVTATPEGMAALARASLAA